MPSKAHVLGDEHYLSAEVQSDNNKYRDIGGQHVTYYEDATWETRGETVVFRETNNMQMPQFCMASLTPV